MKAVQQEYVQRMPLDQVQPHPQNPRQGDVGAIYESIDYHGFYGTILVQRSTGFILAGNHRYLAAMEHGATDLPALVLDVDEDQAKRILLVDNRTNDLAAYDDSELRGILESLRIDTGSLKGSGYDGDDLDDLIALLDHDLMDPGKSGDTQGDEGNVTIRLDLTSEAAGLWRAHRGKYDTDTEAVMELL